MKMEFFETSAKEDNRTITGLLSTLASHIRIIYKDEELIYNKYQKSNDSLSISI